MYGCRIAVVCFMLKIYLVFVSRGDEFRSEEEYIRDIERKGSKSIVPYIRNQYSGYYESNAAMASAKPEFPMIIHRATNISMEIETWSGHVFNLFSYLDEDVLKWHNYRTQVTQISLFCNNVPGKRFIYFAVTLPDGSVKNVRSVARTCPCAEYTLTLNSTHGGSNTRQIVQNVAKKTCTKEPNRLSAVGRLFNVKQLAIYNTQVTGLTKEELSQFPSLETIDIKGNPIVGELLNDRMLCGFQALYAFSIIESYGNLQTFPQHIFNCHEELNITFIFLASHNFTTVPRYAFAQAASKVRYVGLQNNNIGVIEKDAFHGMDSLEILSIRQNNIITIDGGLPIFQSLQVFHLYRSNSTMELSLTNLNLNNQQNLEMFEYGIHPFTSVVTGNVCSNVTRKVSFFQIYTTNISQLPDDFLVNCNSLQYLQLHDNNLQVLRAGSFPTVLPELRLFSVTGNQLDEQSDWTEILSKMPGLELLYVSSNLLSTWDVTLSIIPSLQQLHISKNKLTVLKSGVFNELTRLEFIDLSGNKLQAIEPDTFSGLHSLTGIYLNNNALLSVSNVTFKNLTNLKVIDLSYNSIQDLSLDLPSDLLLLRISNNDFNSRLKLYSSDAQRLITTLDVSSNNVRTVTHTCFSNISYARLIAGNNSLEQLDTVNLVGSPYNKDAYLDLSYNNISYIFLNCSQRIEYSTVNLTNNSIKSLHAILGNPASTPCSIGTIDLSWNELIDLKPNMEYLLNDDHTAYHKIDKIDLRFCSIVIMAVHTFMTINFHELDLRYNNLQEIYDLILPAGFPHVINVLHNPLLCMCTIKWLKDALLTPSLTHYMAESCKNLVLSGLSGNVIQKITDVPHDQFLCPALCDQQMAEICRFTFCLTDFLGSSKVYATWCYIGDQDQQTFPSPIGTSMGYFFIQFSNISVLTFPLHEPSEVYYLDLQRNSIEHIPAFSFRYFPNLKTLILSNNDIEIISDDTFLGLTRVEHLSLDNNQINWVGDSTFSTLFQLSTLHLHNNQLTALSGTLLGALPQRPLSELTLHDNPWNCTCNSEFHYFIAEHERIIESPLNITCNNTGQPVIAANLSCPVETIIKLSSHTATAVILPSVLVGLLALVIIIASVTYKHHILLLVMLNMHCPKVAGLFRSKKRTFNEAATKDVFLIYDDTDRRLMRLVKDSVIEELEPPYQLICYDRDFLAGVPMSENINNAVGTTNCALVLLSKGIMENLWAMTMIQAANTRLLEQSYQVILVLMEGIHAKQITVHENCSAELASMLKAKLYLKIGQRMFWEVLKYKLHCPLSDSGREDVITEVPVQNAIDESTSKV